MSLEVQQCQEEEGSREVSIQAWLQHKLPSGSEDITWEIHASVFPSVNGSSDGASLDPTLAGSPVPMGPSSSVQQHTPTFPCSMPMAFQDLVPRQEEPVQGTWSCWALGGKTYPPGIPAKALGRGRILSWREVRSYNKEM